MKKLIVAALLALVMTFGSQADAKAKKTVYIINGNVVENFDGSQLNGQTILSYVIDNGVHKIMTMHVPGIGVRMADIKSVIICDGKEITEEELTAIDSQTIESIKVYKDNSPIYKQYAKEGYDGGVIILTLKK